MCFAMQSSPLNPYASPQSLLGSTEKTCHHFGAQAQREQPLFCRRDSFIFHKQAAKEGTQNAHQAGLSVRTPFSARKYLPHEQPKVEELIFDFHNSKKQQMRSPFICDVSGKWQENTSKLKREKRGCCSVIVVCELSAHECSRGQ